MVAAGVFAAAAAVLALMVTAPEETPLRSATAVGVVLSSDAEPRTFTLGASVRCALGPNSRASLECEATGDEPCSSSPPHALRDARGGLQTSANEPRPPRVLVLEQGSVMAQVSPQPADAPLAEALVIEAGGVRVAVHGTEFSVALNDHDVTVEVTRGSVAVGPVGHRGFTTGHLLVAPARAAFSLDGGRIARLLPPPTLPGGSRGPAALPTSRPAAPVATSTAEPAPSEQPPPAMDATKFPSDDAPAVPVAASERGQAAAPTEPAAPAESAVEPPALTPGTIDPAAARSRIMSCLQTLSQSSAGGDAVRVTISSQVRLRLDRERRIISVRFSPPLKPELQQRCAGAVLGQILAGGSDAPEFGVVFSPR
jgi:hypothetical protein